MNLSLIVFFFFYKQKTAYEMRISDWSSDVCSSDLFRFGARIEATRNPPPLPHAIATEMHRGATAARGHGERHARACDTGTAGGKRSLACLGPRAIGKQPPAAAAIVSGMDLESPCHRIAKQPAALAFKHQDRKSTRLNSSH